MNDDMFWYLTEVIDEWFERDLLLTRDMFWYLTEVIDEWFERVYEYACDNAVNAYRVFYIGKKGKGFIMIVSHN